VPAARAAHPAPSPHPHRPRFSVQPDGLPVMSSSAGVVPATGSPRSRHFYRLTTDSATILRIVHRFFVRQRSAGRSRGLRNPMQRAAWATGVSLSTVSRVRSDDFFDGLPESGERERRERVPRIPDADGPPRRWPLWWANTRGCVDAIRAVHCCVCVQFSKSRFPLTHADRFKPHKSPYSAAKCIFVDPVLPMSEFI